MLYVMVIACRNYWKTCGPSKPFPVLGRNNGLVRKCFANIDIEFLTKSPEQLGIHGRCIIWMQDTSFRPKFSLISNNSPLLPYEYFEETLLINSLAVFKILKVNNVLVIKNLISVVFT